VEERGGRRHVIENVVTIRNAGRDSLDTRGLGDPAAGYAINETGLLDRYIVASGPVGLGSANEETTTIGILYKRLVTR
jgi:hypothetical protein